MVILAETRFMDKLQEDAETGCWHWMGSKFPTGYGRFKVGGKVCYAHRFSYELFVGPIPDGLSIDHLCRNHPCVNPGHLEPVTHRVNVLRGCAPTAHNAAKTHCPKGHAYDLFNTYVNRQGGRSCKACGLEAAKRYRARRGAA